VLDRHRLRLRRFDRELGDRGRWQRQPIGLAFGYDGRLALAGCGGRDCGGPADVDAEHRSGHRDPKAGCAKMSHVICWTACRNLLREATRTFPSLPIGNRLARYKR
jgi:hypothetical protein